MGIIGVLAALLLPTLTQGQLRAKRIACVSDLRQTGLAFHLFAHDHSGQFPMQVPAADGGSLEFLQEAYRANGESYVSFHHFQALSSELVTPRLLACPGDTRPPAVNFAAFSNTNLSYFVAANAQYDKPNSFLAGDRSLTNNWPMPQTILRIDETNSVRWTPELHRFRGNVAFSDGHVEELNKPALIYTVNNTFAAAVLLLPSVKSTGAGFYPGEPAVSPAAPVTPTPAPVSVAPPMAVPPPVYLPPPGPVVRPPAVVASPPPSAPPPAAAAVPTRPTQPAPVKTISAAGAPKTNSAAAPVPALPESFGFADTVDNIVHKVEQFSWLLWLLLLLFLLVLIVRLWLRQRHN